MLYCPKRSGCCASKSRAQFVGGAAAAAPQEESKPEEESKPDESVMP